MEKLKVGVYTRAREGEIACGNACLVKRVEGVIFLAVGDGIGHGPEAARAAEIAIASMEASIEASINTGLVNIFQLCHRQLKGTRGAVAALCRVDRSQGLWQAAIVGNIHVKILTAKGIITPMATPGILGYNYPHQLLIAKGSYQEGDLFLIHSDGIQEGAVPLALLANYRLTTEELVRLIGEKYGRRDDDVAVIVAR